MSKLLNADGTTTPLCRGAIVTAAFGYIATSSKPVGFTTLVAAIMDDTCLPEEAVAADVGEALLWLVSSGTVASNAYDEMARQLRIGHGTRFWISGTLRSFIWREPMTIAHDGGDTVK